MNPRTRHLLSVAWKIGLAALLLAWAFHAIFHDQIRSVLAAQGTDLDVLPRTTRWKLVWSLGPAELWQTLVTAHPGWLWASILLWGVTIVLGAWRWLIVLRALGIDLGVRHTLEVSFIAHFFNSFLLGSTGGDLLKAYYAARVTRHRKTEAVTAVILDRALGLLSMLAFAVLMILPNLTFVRSHGLTRLLALFLLSLLLIASAVLFVSLRSGLSRRLPSARLWLRRLPKGEVLERSLQACRTFGHHLTDLSRVLAISVLLNLACILQLLTLIWAYGLTVPLRPMCFIIPSVICLSSVPVTPNGLGVRDNLYLYLLNLPDIGVSANTAVAVSLVAYAGSLIWSAVGGVLYIVLRRQPVFAVAVADDQAGGPS